MSCPVCGSEDHVHCSTKCERCGDVNNPHPTFAKIFCRRCKKSLCYPCYYGHAAECHVQVSA